MNSHPLWLACCFITIFHDVLATSELVACSLEGVGSKLSSYVDNVTSFFNEFSDHLQILSDLVEMNDQNMLGPGPLTKELSDLKMMHDNVILTGPEMQFEESWWGNLEAKTPKDIKNRSTQMYGFWADPSADRKEELYAAAWGGHYSFDWENVSRMAQSGTPTSYFTTPAENRLLVRQANNNLTKRCIDDGLVHCLGSSNLSCPGWCRTPEVFNNTWIGYQISLTRTLTDYFSILLKKYQGKAFAWYYFGVPISFCRYAPALPEPLGVYLKSDFGFPKVHLQGPILNEDKGLVWSPLYWDAASTNLMVTGMVPIFVGEPHIWIGGVNVDVTIAPVSTLLGEFKGTQSGFSILSDTEGTVVAASEEIYSTLFCPTTYAELANSCNGSAFKVKSESSWDANRISGRGGLGPNLDQSKFTPLHKTGTLFQSIMSQESGTDVAMLVDGQSYYVAWKTLSDLPLLGGPKLILCVPKREIDNAAKPVASPHVINLLDEETTFEVTLSNNGDLAWNWTVQVEGGNNDDSFSFSSYSGVLATDQTATIQGRRKAGVIAQLMFTGGGEYSACFDPQVIAMSRKEPVQLVSQDTKVVLVLGIVLGVVGGFIVCSLVVLGIRWIVTQRKERIRLEKEAAILQEQILQDKLSEGLNSVRTLGFPMAIISAVNFCAMHRDEMASLHEGCRNAGRLVILDTVELIHGFTKDKGYKVVFFSYQRLAWDNCPPDPIQLNCMRKALKELSSRMQIPIENLYVWLDILSIPQVHPALRTLAVKSIYIYASLADKMVIICPESVHQDTKERAGAESYKRRVWCRVEQMAHACHHGVESMYVCTQEGMVPLPEGWLDTVSRVFDGDMTCCRLNHTAGSCDKLSLVSVMMALYFNLYLQHEGLIEQRGSFQRLWNIIMKEKAAVFPALFEYSTVDANGDPTTETRELFGSMIERLEQHTKTLDNERARAQLAVDTDDDYYKFGASSSMVTCPDSCPRDQKELLPDLPFMHCVSVRGRI